MIIYNKFYKLDIHIYLNQFIYLFIYLQHSKTKILSRNTCLSLLLYNYIINTPNNKMNEIPMFFPDEGPSSFPRYFAVI